MNETKLAHQFSTGLLRLKETAFELGFELIGVAPAKPPKTFDAFEHWIDAGYHAGMNYLAEKKFARKSPDFILSGVQSLFMLGVSYQRVLSSAEHPVQQLTGIAEYARGIDYHDWIRSRLKHLSAAHREIFPHGHCRGVVDTAPILEKQYAAEAGLGQIGKNTLLIHPKFGTKFFLAVLLSTERFELEHLEELPNLCGNCRSCLEACPTGALVEPFVLDARRCLNYWTIEHRGEIPNEIQKKLGKRFFGCDTCQNICHWNRNNLNLPTGTIEPNSLDTKTLCRIAAGSPLQRKYPASPQ
jgi:epoxyqueuosine reductase